MLSLVQNKQPLFPWFQQSPLLKENTFKTPNGRMNNPNIKDMKNTLQSGFPLGAIVPVLALCALELAVKRTGAGTPSNGCGRGTGLALQSQVDWGTNAALLQVDALRAALMA